MIQGSEVGTMVLAKHEENIKYDLKKPAERLGSGVSNLQVLFDIVISLSLKISTG